MTHTCLSETDYMRLYVVVYSFTKKMFKINVIGNYEVQYVIGNYKVQLIDAVTIENIWV